MDKRRQKKANGDAGYRSPCPSHAKRMLYHLSYIPNRKKGKERDHDMHKRSKKRGAEEKNKLKGEKSSEEGRHRSRQECIGWIKEDKKKANGDAGYRSPCPSHAKRMLYHLSYIPITIKRNKRWR